MQQRKPCHDPPVDKNWPSTPPSTAVGAPADDSVCREEAPNCQAADWRGLPRVLKKLNETHSHLGVRKETSRNIMSHFFLWFVCLGSWFDTITLTSFGQDEMFHFQLKRDETVHQPWTPAAKDVASGKRLLSLGSQGYTSQSVWPRIRLDDPESVSLCVSLFVVIWLNCILHTLLYFKHFKYLFTNSNSRKRALISLCAGSAWRTARAAHNHRRHHILRLPARPGPFKRSHHFRLHQFG